MPRLTMVNLNLEEETKNNKEVEEELNLKLEKSLNQIFENENETKLAKTRQSIKEMRHELKRDYDVLKSMSDQIDKCTIGLESSIALIKIIENSMNRNIDSQQNVSIKKRWTPLIEIKMKEDAEKHLLRQKQMIVKYFLIINISRYKLKIITEISTTALNKRKYS